jgi:hypothetical protein
MVNRVEINSNLIEFDGKYRIEMGPPRKVAVATEELLSNELTAEHYQVGAKDALGKEIVLGEEMTYVDWHGPRVWWVFELQEAPAELCEERGWSEGSHYWVELTTFPTQSEAESHALSLL